MKLDVLVIAAHPDDAEICVGGTILKLVAAGARVGVCDLTRGEWGTRGDAARRAAETDAASARMGLQVRRNLDLPDGRVPIDVRAREALARVLREHAPEWILAHHTEDLHPDHAACGALARQAWYLSGLRRLAEAEGGPPARRPRGLLHFQGHVPFEPTLVVDVSEVWEAKCEVIRCYASQLEPQDPSDRGQHLLFGADILARAESKARFFGERIGAAYGEPFLHRGPLGVPDPRAFLGL